MIDNLGKYIAGLRSQRGLTLRKIEDLTGIPNAYLSQLETGQKKYLPSPTLLFKLAECLGVSTKELLAKAGYLKQPAIKESLEKQVDKAFRHAVSDPQFSHGSTLKHKYDFNIKRFVVELYEKATGRLILEHPLTDEDIGTVTGQMQSGNPPPRSESGSGKTSKNPVQKKPADSDSSAKRLSIRSIRKEGL